MRAAAAGPAPAPAPAAPAQALGPAVVAPLAAPPPPRLPPVPANEVARVIVPDEEVLHAINCQHRHVVKIEGASTRALPTLSLIHI